MSERRTGMIEFGSGLEQLSKRACWIESGWSVLAAGCLMLMLSELWSR